MWTMHGPTNDDYAHAVEVEVATVMLGATKRNSILASREPSRVHNDYDTTSMNGKL